MVDTLTFWIITILYLGLTMFLGYLGWKKTKHADDYLLAGRKVNPTIIGLSYGATFISTSAIVGFGGMAANFGMGLIWLTVLNIGVGILFAFIVFGKRANTLAHKLRAVTLPDLLGKRYKSYFLQYSAATVIIIGMPLYTAAVLIGGSRFIETTLLVPFSLALLAFAAVTAVYVVFGGLRAVMLTDAMQGAIMLIGMITLLIMTYLLLGGITEANSQLTSMSSQVPPAMVAQGMNGYTSMPDFGSPIWLTLVTTVILGVGVGVLAEPQLAIRFMTAKDSKALNRAIPIGCFFIICTTGVAFTVGALTNVYFNDASGMTSVQAAGNIDKVMPLFINSTMPDLFIAVFMIVLLAAAMSTLSSIFHTMGSAMGHDIWCNFKACRLAPERFKNQDRKPSMLASRIGVAIMIMVSVVLAFAMPPDIIARATAMWFGLAACAMLPAYAHALFSKRLSTTAAKWSLAVGTISWFLWTALIHKAESSVLGISNALFGVPSLLDLPWSNIDPIVIALPLSFLALIIAYFLDTNVKPVVESAVSD